jgi:hypothetical protein
LVSVSFLDRLYQLLNGFGLVSLWGVICRELKIHAESG